MVRCLFGRRGWLGVVLGMVPFGLSAQAERAVSVESVEFSTVRAPGIRDPFYEVAIELRGERLTVGNTTVSFHRNVAVRLDLAFVLGRAARREYYSGGAMLVGLAAGEEKIVYFYLPPEIVERDRLSSSPTGWRVSLAVDDRALPHQESAYSDSLRKPETARHFLARIEQESPRNEGLLLPIFLTPFYNEGSGRLEESPSYVRHAPDMPGSPPIRPPLSR